MAHLFCELFLRMQLCEENSCPFPLTHQNLADALGLTPTRIGRVMDQLRAMKLITLEKYILTVPDLGELQKIGRFNRNYLHQ